MSSEGRVIRNHSLRFQPRFIEKRHDLLRQRSFLAVILSSITLILCEEDANIPPVDVSFELLHASASQDDDVSWC